jgi:hypothetical protein
MFFQEEIKEYSIDYYGSGENANYPMRAIISLYGENRLIGALYFYRKKEYLPDEDSPGTNHIVANYPIEDLPAIIDLLRNEKPIWLRLIDNLALISTSGEPIGEEEKEKVNKLIRIK